MNWRERYCVVYYIGESAGWDLMNKILKRESMRVVTYFAWFSLNKDEWLCRRHVQCLLSALHTHRHFQHLASAYTRRARHRSCGIQEAVVRLRKAPTYKIMNNKFDAWVVKSFCGMSGGAWTPLRGCRFTGGYYVTESCCVWKEVCQLYSVVRHVILALITTTRQ